MGEGETDKEARKKIAIEIKEKAEENTIAIA
jgi:hypothetical protein